MKNFIKKILAIWISIYLIVVPPFAHAASPSGWSFSKYDIAQTIVTAIKNGAPASIKYTPKLTSIAKFLAKGAGAGALAYVLAKYGSDIYDWAYDELTKSVVGTPKTSAITFNDPLTGAVADYTGEQACAILTKYYVDNPSVGTLTFKSPDYCIKADGSIFAALTSHAPAKRTITVDELANSSLADAKAGIAPAKAAIENSVADDINLGSLDAALDAAKAEADATHGCGTGTSWNGSACVATPDTPTDTPFDPTDIIDAIGKVFDAVMTLPDVINNALDDLLNDIKDFFQPVVDSVTNFFDWVKTTYDEFVKPDNTPTDVDVNVPQTQTIDTDINFGGSCPANVTGSFVIGGQTTTFNIMDWSQFCLIMSTYLKPLVIALASYQAVKILAGRNESN